MLIIDLLTYGENDVAAAVGNGTDEQLRQIGERADYYLYGDEFATPSGASPLLSWALARAAVEIIEGAPRDLRWKLFPEWGETLARLRTLPDVPAARASADLLAQVDPAWGNRVIARQSMHDLLFTLPNDPYPFTRFVVVECRSAEGGVAFARSTGVYTFRLHVKHGGPLSRYHLVVTADKSLAPTASLVLDSFLSQLATESA